MSWPVKRTSRHNHNIVHHGQARVWIPSKLGPSNPSFVHLLHNDPVGSWQHRQKSGRSRLRYRIIIIYFLFAVGSLFKKRPLKALLLDTNHELLPMPPPRALRSQSASHTHTLTCIKPGKQQCVLRAAVKFGRGKVSQKLARPKEAIGNYAMPCVSEIKKNKNNGD